MCVSIPPLSRRSANGDLQAIGQQFVAIFVIDCQYSCHPGYPRIIPIGRIPVFSLASSLRISMFLLPVCLQPYPAEPHVHMQYRCNSDGSQYRCREPILLTWNSGQLFFSLLPRICYRTPLQLTKQAKLLTSQKWKSAPIK